MWKNIIDKLFCLHSWKSIAKNIYPNNWANGNRYEQTTEVFVCQKCGKFKQINY